MQMKQEVRTISAESKSNGDMSSPMTSLGNISPDMGNTSPNISPNQSMVSQ